MEKTVHRHAKDMAHSLCWNCKGTLEEADLCGTCVKIQPFNEDRNYFDILGVPRRLILEGDLLTEKFHEKSRLFHPDYHRLEVDKEQEISLNNASRLNQAFKILKDPFLRASYYLTLERTDSPSAHSKNHRLSKQDLMELMELKEELESDLAAGNKESAFKRLATATGDLEEEILSRMQRIDQEEAGISGDREQPSPSPEIEQERVGLSRDIEYRKYLLSIKRELSIPATVKETT